MKYKSDIQIVICLIWAGLWLFMSDSTVQGARVAGEKGVVSATPQASPEARKSDQKRPPPRRPIPQRPVQEKEKAIPKKAIDEKKSVPKKDQPEARYVTIDFDDVDIAIFIKFISELTGKNFVIDKAVRGKVTIISPTKITAEEAYKVFESVLEVHGYAAVPAGKIIKIVPALQARSKDIETRLRREAITPEDKVVTQLIPLRYADPNELKKLFIPFISKTSVIVSYPPTGMLIVTDVLSNIKRLLGIIEAIDVEGIGEEISVIPLQHATASVLGQSLTTVFQRGRVRRRGQKVAPGAPTVRIVPDERTNSLITVASEDDTVKIKQLINLLDKETPRGEGDVHVYYLQNAIAEDLAKVLMAIPTKDVKAPQKGKAPVISKEVHVVADKATNSLVIMAKKDDFIVLEDVIEKLDIARNMVYIEALLMEVSVDRDFALGAEWFAVSEIATYDGKSYGAFGASRPGTSILPSVDLQNKVGDLKTGFSLGVLGDVIEIQGVKFPTIGAVVRAFRDDNDVNILSTPQIMTTDNEEAEIKVVDNIPFLTRQERSVTATLIDYSSYEFKDVGVTLNIIPQISQERFVRLKITQEVSQVVEQEEVGLPTTLKRTAKTTVTIKDGQTIVIGGLIDETLNQTRYQVPCLGNLSCIGWAFRSLSRSEDRTNLFIFVTPHIIENPVEAKKVYEEKKEAIEGVREGVIRLYEQRGKKKEDVLLSDLGYRHLQENDYDRAKEYFEKALEINPDNPYAILNMGVIYEREGKRDDAIKMYERVISLNPEERDFSAPAPERKGRKLLDIAKDNLENLEK